jgi:RNA polymerase sigma factor (sigma-70 family)
MADEMLVLADKNQNIIRAVTEYGKQLFGFIRSRVKSDEDAEDIIQDVWYQFSNIEEIAAIENVSSWLYRVAKNKITDSFRKKRPERLENFIIETDSGEIDLKDILLSEPTGTEDKLLKKMFWNAFLSALEELPVKQRDVFVQNELEDKSLKEISEATGESIKTIISRKGYAVKHLRERLAEVYAELIIN